jgi:hypothetical protein
MYHHLGLESQRKSLYKFSIRNGVGDGIIIINRGETVWWGGILLITLDVLGLRNVQNSERAIAVFLSSYIQLNGIVFFSTPKQSSVLQTD